MLRWLCGDRKLRNGLRVLHVSPNVRDLEDCRFKQYATQRKGYVCRGIKQNAGSLGGRLSDNFTVVACYLIPEDVEAVACFPPHTLRFTTIDRATSRRKVSISVPRAIARRHGIPNPVYWALMDWIPPKWRSMHISLPCTIQYIRHQGPIDCSIYVLYYDRLFHAKRDEATSSCKCRFIMRLSHGESAKPL